jgi:predicted transcriptional regulator
MAAHNRFYGLHKGDWRLSQTVEPAQLQSDDIIGYTAEIVSSFVANNTIATEGLPQVIQDVYRAISNLGEPEKLVEPPKPAVDVKKSVFPDYLVCLEDGKRLSMLKRHLMASYQMTPDQYRAKWALPSTYPMVAPNYAETRSRLARESGLGRSKPAPAPKRERRKKAA